jgi:hypothetical protein
LPEESTRIFLSVLRNADDGDGLVSMRLVDALQKRKGILAGRAGNFEECCDPS